MDGSLHDKGRDCARTEEVLETYRKRALRAELRLRKMEAMRPFFVGLRLFAEREHGSESFIATIDEMEALLLGGSE
jgi:hypothetical protein